jgi:hypothetical protein
MILLMNEYKRKHPRSRLSIGVRVAVAITGLILSVVLHELFHVIMHWGHITSVGLFTDSHTIFEVVVNDTPAGYDVNLEELVAYMITGIVILITTIIVWHLNDISDKRTLTQTLNLKDNELDDINVDEVLKMAYRRNPMVRVMERRV